MSLRRIKQCIFIYILLIVNQLNASVLIEKDFSSEALSGKIGVAKDFRSDGFYDVNYVNSLPFERENTVPTDSTGCFWIKLTVKNNEDYSKKLIISTSRFQEIRLYYKDIHHRIINVHSGLETPFKNRDFINGAISYLPFIVNANSSQDIYIWVKQKKKNLYQYAPLPLTLSDFNTESNQKETSEMILYFFLGAIVLMTFYNFALYVIIKREVYLFYILNNIFILLFVVAQSGFIDTQFFDSPVYHEKILLIIGNIAFIFYMIFSKTLLNFRKFDPAWNTRINIALIIWPCLLLFVFLDMEIIAVSFGSIGALIGYTIVVISCIKAIKAGSAPARFFLVGNIAYYAAIIVSIFQINNLLPTKIIGLTAIEMVEIGTMIQLALFSLTLGVIINVMRSKLLKKEIEVQKQQQKDQIRYAHLVEQKNIELETKVVERTKALNQSSRIIEQKNSDILDSMNYARRIQNAILPSRDKWQNLLVESFYLYIPKDIISGDFYWVNKSITTNKLFLAAADCTGHGIPGAMVSVVGVNSLNKCINERNLENPSIILDNLTELVEESFAETDDSEDVINDGMDIGLCSIEEIDGKTFIEYAGANNPLWLIREDSIPIEPNNYHKVTKHDTGRTLYEIKGDKQPIGKFQNRKPFTNYQIEVFKGDQLYMFTDGYSDQFGGPKGKKLKLNNFRELIFEIQQKSQTQQKAALHNHFRKWKGNEEQVDDVCVVGIKI